MSKNIKKYIPLMIFVLILGILFWIGNRYLDLRPDQIQAWINSFGVWAPLLFIVIYAVRPLILFPASLLSITGGLAFGAWEGIIYILIGATLSGIVAFMISKIFHNSFVKKVQEGRIARITTLMEERGFFYVLILRLIPFINFDLISYSAGLANVKVRAFVLATFIGIIPGTFAFSFLGSSFAEGDIQVIVITLIVCVLLLTIPIIFRKKVISWLGLEKK